MTSKAHNFFLQRSKEISILFSHRNVPPPEGIQAHEVEETCLKATIACAVGAWEGFVEKILVEYIENAKPAKKPWPLIQQFEYVVKKETSELNTPSWDKVRGLVYSVTGLDVMNAWWDRSIFANAESAKQFFDDMLRVRHSFAHGFSVPADIADLGGAPISPDYTKKVVDYLFFMSIETDKLLEYDLINRHGNLQGWKI